MLPDERGAVDGVNRFVKCYFNDFFGEEIFFRLSVDGKENGFVGGEEVGVGGREAFVVGVDGVGEWEFDEVVRLPGGGSEALKFFFHETELHEVFIGGVGAACIDDCVVGCEASEGVDV